MDLELYKEYLKPTIGIYNKKTQDYLVEELFKNELITETVHDSKEDKDIKVIKETIKQYDNTLIGSVDEIGVPVIKYIEQWEYIREYQYSVLFESCYLEKENILSKISNADLSIFNIDDPEVEEINDIISRPTVYYNDDVIILKFSLGKRCINPDTEKELKYKYTINVVFHLNSKIVEIRYNPINGLFVDDYKGFYKKNISAVKAWVNSYLEIKLDKFIIDDVIENLKKDESLRLEGQDMRFSDGGKACLEIGSNTSYTLPLLGELKNIIDQNQEEFNKAIAIKQMLETWIESKEEEADYLWICLCWPDSNKRKTYDVKVRFQFDYFDEGESLLYHYSGPIGMERMNNVVQTIIKCL